MKFGLVHIFEAPEFLSEHAAINDQIDLMVLAEELGYDSVWAGEHHFSRYGVCPNPLVALAAVAARTSSIRLGTAVSVVPLHHPVRLAEEIALLDQISDGRVEAGVGRGYQPAEFQGLDVSQDDSRNLLFECVEILKKLWTETECSHEGLAHSFRDLTSHPRPRQDPHPPLWMASLSEDSFAICGRLGLNLLCAPAFGFDIVAGAASVGDYRAALREHGRDTDHHEVGALTITYVGESMEQARADLEPAVMRYYQALAQSLPAPQTDDESKHQGRETARSFLEGLDWDTAVDLGAVICGDPDHVAERVDELRALCGITSYLAWMRIGGLSGDRVGKSMRLFAEHVIPQVNAGRGATRSLLD